MSTVKYPREFLTHPHAKIVQKELEGMMKALVSRGLAGSTCMFQRNKSHVLAKEQVNSLTIGKMGGIATPVTTSLTVQGDIRLSVPHLVNPPHPSSFREVEELIAAIEGFGAAHRGRYYLQQDGRANLSFHDVSSLLIQSLNKLKPIVLGYMLDWDSQHIPTDQTPEERDLAVVSLVLRDELEAYGEHDFSARVLVVGPDFVNYAYQHPPQWDRSK